VSRMSISTLLDRILKRERASVPTTTSALEEVLAPLPEPFRGTLNLMYTAESMVGIDGQNHATDTLTRISPTQGMWLYEQCRSTKALDTLEIGFAYGFSAVFFLAAVAKNGTGSHTAVDPFQRTHWHGIGLANVRAVGADSSFQLIEDRSDRAATDLARRNSSFDVIFIDGNHRLDDVLVDFYLHAPLCRIGGLIVFDDMWMGSVQTVVSFVRSNRRDFVEIATTHPNVCVFRRTGEDLRRWDDYQPFAVAGSGRKAQ
jgi:predicted O-methyltransferase YrrM